MFFTLIAILSIPLITGILLQFPAIQTQAVRFLTDQIEAKTQHKISIKSIDISWFDQASIDSIAMLDVQGNRLFEISRVEMDFDLFSLLFNDGIIHQNHIELFEPAALLTFIETPDSLTALNINYFIQAFQLNSKNKSKNSFELVIDQLTVHNGRFRYENQFAQHTEKGLDPNHFYFENINSILYDFNLVPGTIEAFISELTLIEKASEVTVNSLKSKFMFSPKAMVFEKLDLVTGDTRIGDSLAFKFESTRDFSSIYDSVSIHAKIKNSHIHQKDIVKILPFVSRFPNEITLNGNFSGKLSDFVFSDMVAEFGKTTRLRGSIGMSGLPLLSETFLNTRFYGSQFSFEDIQPFTGLSATTLTDNLGVIQLDGQFLGYINDFVANGNFRTDFGRIQSDINIKIPEQGLPKYSGKLNLHAFDLGKVVDSKQIGQVEFSGSVEGKGFNLKSASMHVTGNIPYININNYKYVNVYSNGDLSNEFYEGYLSVDDPNLKFEADGTMDLRKSAEYVNIDTEFEHIDLQMLGLSKNPLQVKGKGIVSFEGLDPDEIQINSSLSDVAFFSDSSQLKLDTIRIISEQQENERIISLYSEILDIDLVGNYKLSKLYPQLTELVNDYKKIISNDSIQPIEHKPSIDSLNTYQSEINFQINIKSINPFLKLLQTNTFISNNTMLEGNYIHDGLTMVNLSSRIDSLKYGTYEFYNNQLELSSIKNTEQEVLATLYLHSNEQVLSGLKTAHLFAEANWDNKHMDLEFNLEQPDFNNQFNLNANLDFLQDSTLITLSESSIRALDNHWDISKDGRIIIKNGSAWVRDVELSSKEQFLSLSGLIAEDSFEPLIISLDRVEVDNINSLINKELKGEVTGEMYIRNILGNTTIENDVLIRDFFINNFKVGNTKTSVRWNRDSRQFDIRSSVTYEEDVTMDLEGYYDPDSDNPLYIDADLVNAQVNILEPFIGTYFSELGGTLTGGFNITGSLTYPRIFGKGNLHGGEVMVNYLKTGYFINGIFSFSEDKIFLDDIKVKDRFGNGGKLGGFINHGGFRDMSVDLTGEFTNIQVLNTNAGDNSWFYGQGFGTGTIKFQGSVNNLLIAADARTEKGTRIYLPMEGTEIIESSDFVNFISFSDSSKRETEIVESVDLKGVVLDLNLDVTSDAYCEIIFDIKAGDIIRGRGTGEISLIIDTNGEFSMFGPLTISEGWYNFTLYNLINKEFDIAPGGTINWYGDPYEGILDLTANYRQVASIAPIIDPFYKDATEIKRKYPANVIMDMQGPLLNPEISFDINVEDLPVGEIELTGVGFDGTTRLDLEFEFDAFMNRIDEQELKRQVFSLIVLKSFSKEVAFNYGGAFGSVSELFSNQLSYWMSQVDENLEIDFDVDLTAFSEEAFNTFQLRLSYTFLDGRLRVTGDGTYYDEFNSGSEGTYNGLIGNWSVEYALTKDGRMKVRMYNRNNYNAVTGDNIFTGNSTGVSLQYSQSFNEFLKEMSKVFTNEKKKNEKKSDSKPETDAKLKEEDEEN